MRIKLLLLFVLLSILLVGCGNIPQAFAAASQGESTLPDSVVITTPFRNGTPLPATANITDPARAQALYDALYALPHAQKHRWMGLGPAVSFYTLDFYSQNHLVKHVLVPNISFNGFALDPNDNRQTTRQFWSLLDQTIRSSVTH